MATALRPGRRTGAIQLSGSGRYRLGLAFALGFVLALAGGASRYDAVQQMLVRLAAIAVIGATLWPLDLEALRRHRRTLIAVLSLWLLPLLQLLPLPPSLWALLPGHAIHARIAAESGTWVWRPLSLTPDLTLNALLALLPATAAALILIHVDADGRRQLAWALLLVAAYSALLGFLQLAAGGTSYRLYRASSADSAVGLFANRNHQAVLLACSLPLAGALAGIAARAGRLTSLAKTGLIALAALLLAGIVATGSRMGLFLGLAGAGAALWSFRAAAPRRWSLHALLVLGAGAVVLLFLLLLGALRSGALARLAAIDAVGETRAEMLPALWRTARAFLPFGSGFGSFDSVYRRYEPDALLSTIYMNQAHDEPIQLLIEGGIAAILLLGLFAWWWTRRAAAILRDPARGPRRAMAAACVAMTALMMASSLVDYPLRTPLLSSIFLFACLEMARYRGGAQPG